MSSYDKYSSHHYSPVMPAEVGIMTGAIGACIGYTLAPRKYNLEKLLTMQQDVFEKSISKKFGTSASASQKSAYNLILNARKSIADAVKNNSQDVKLAESLKSPKLNNAYRSIKKFFPRARTQAAIVLGVIGAFLGILAKIIFFGDKTS